MVLRAGGGMFYERQSLALERQDLLYSGQRTRQYVVENPAFPVDPASLTAVPPSAWHLDPRAELPYLIQAGSGVDERPGHFRVLSAEYYTLRGGPPYPTHNPNPPAILAGSRLVPHAARHPAE